MKQIKNSIITFIIFTAFFINATEFNPGPYGQNYFDIADQFKLLDLNGKLDGDVNQDEILNIQDIILFINNILGIIPFTNNQIELDLFKEAV